MYQALYRKYRPRTFDDVAGQEHITQTLKTQVASGRESHAYLFVGTRGTGKTTCAKILSRAVNCENPQGGDPCNECPSCLAIESGQATDVLEIDAASNNGVDNVRALRDEAIFSPASAKKRVYIIDEVHMLSNSAFNALLKILEEPPEHLLFILATTELHKVPATIISRCQRFSFRRLTRETIAERLLLVAKGEGFALAQDAAELISRLSDGAMRDAISILDQCAGVQNIDIARVRDVLGLPASGETYRLLSAIAARDAKTAFLMLDELYMAGKQASTLFDELLEMTRDALVAALVPGGDNLLTGALGTRELKALKIPPARLTHLLSALNKATGEFTRGSGDRTVAELYLASMCDERLDDYPAAIIARLEALEKGKPPVAEVFSPPEMPEAIENTPPKAAALSDEPDDELPPWEMPEPPVRRQKAEPEPEIPPELQPEGGEPEVTFEPEKVHSIEPETENEVPPSDDVWQRILGELPVFVKATIEDSTAKLKGDILSVSTSDAFTLSMLGSESTVAAVTDAAERVTGRRVAIKAHMADAPSAGDAQTKLEDLSERFADLVEFE